MIVIHRAEEGGYWCEVPALEGGSAQGETVEELLGEARDAIRSHIEALIEDGRAVPEDTDIMIATVETQQVAWFGSVTREWAAAPVDSVLARGRPTRRRFLQAGLALAGLGLLAGCGLPPSPAQSPKIPVVGVLSGFSQSAAQSIADAFPQGLRELGYVEGQNVVLEYRFADGRDERLPGLAAELVARPVSVIFAPDTPAALAARTATAAVPIVVASSDPVALGLVASLARPAGNVTGLSFANVLHAGKNLELLKQAAPATRRVVALWYAPNASSAALLRELQDAAPRLGVELQPVGVQGPDDFETAFQSAAGARADALFVISGPEMNTRQGRVLEFVASTRLPSMFPRREYVEAGGLMSYGVSFPAVYRRAATYVDKILKGASPADLPVEQPTTFDFIINLKTARDIGLTIPQEVLLQATEVIQ